MKKALIFGISGQDGAYLSHYLLTKNYQVYGTSRDAQLNTFNNLIKLGVKDKIHLKSVSLIDFRSVLQNIAEIKPDEIYNLAGQSSVGLSFELPVETFESITIGTLNILETIRYLGLPVKFYNACSGECFGNTNGMRANEKMAFKPCSPYAVAKSAAFWHVSNYREAYGLFACSGILFNHESPLRPERFVTQKIIAAALRIADGSDEKLHLGNVNIERDWGWAPEYVEAMWAMLQQDKADDYVIATGRTYSLMDYIKTSFYFLDLNWKDHVIIDNQFIRPMELMVGKADPSKAMDELKWKAEYDMKDVIQKMIVQQRDSMPEADSCITQ